MVTEAAEKINVISGKYGVSKYYSPRMILHQQNLDYEKHYKFALGTYVQGHNEPLHTNTSAAQSLDCIYLRYHASKQGGHELLHLQTNQLVVRRIVTSVPMSPAIIHQIHSITKHEGMLKGLKISNRFGNILFESALIAGVDYDDEEDFGDEFYEEENSDSEDDNLHDEVYDEIDPNKLSDLIPQHTVDNEENTKIEDEEENGNTVNNEENDNIEDEEENEVHEENASTGIDNESYISTEENHHEEGIDNSDPVNNSNSVTEIETVPTVTTRIGRTSKGPIRLIANMLQKQMLVFVK